MRGLCELTDHEDMVQSLLDHYYAASEETKAEGRAWYPNAREMIRVLSKDTWAAPIETTAAVVAILSPNTRWGANLAGAARLQSAYYHDEVEPPRSATLYYRNAKKAWEILNGARFEAVVSRETSPKVWAFYKNLCGDEWHVTVDKWMTKAAGIKCGRVDGNVNTVENMRVGLAVKDAARRVAETPAAFQAIVWCQVRGGSA